MGIVEISAPIRPGLSHAFYQTQIAQHTIKINCRFWKHPSRLKNIRSCGHSRWRERVGRSVVSMHPEFVSASVIRIIKCRHRA